MPLYDVTYHRMLAEKGSDHQTVDQAMIGIGDAVVNGFAVVQRVIEDRDGKSVTVVSVTSPHGILFGAYEFRKVA